MKEKIVSDLFGYIELLEESKGKNEFASVDRVISYALSSPEKKFVVPLFSDEVMIIMKSPIPNLLLSGFGTTGDVMVTTMTIAHFNFAFLALEEVSILMKE